MNKLKQEAYTVHENIVVNTTDREDHSFSGIMFPVKCKDIISIDQLVINSVSIRGHLGPITVWVTKNEIQQPTLSLTQISLTKLRNSFDIVDTTPKKVQKVYRRGSSRCYNIRDSQNKENNLSNFFNNTCEITMKKKNWIKIYKHTHDKSVNSYTKLDFSYNPIILRPGQIKGIYIHSSLSRDDAIVYDNRRNIKTHDDSFITIFSGRAHVSPKAFGSVPIWGWGNAWRDNREFVGKLSYGIIYQLWNPREYYYFGTQFQYMTRSLFACQRRLESPMSILPDECIFYILSMCKWDWMDDTIQSICQDKIKKRSRILDMIKTSMPFSLEELSVSSEYTDNSTGTDDSSILIPTYNYKSIKSILSDDDDDHDDDQLDYSKSRTFYFKNYDDLSESKEEKAEKKEMNRVLSFII